MTGGSSLKVLCGAVNVSQHQLFLVGQAPGLANHIGQGFAPSLGGKTINGEFDTLATWIAISRAGKWTLRSYAIARLLAVIGSKPISISARIGPDQTSALINRGNIGRL